MLAGPAALHAMRFILSQDIIVGIEPEVRAGLRGVYEAHARDPTVHSHARHLLFAFRSAALRAEKSLALAMKDAKASLAYMPSHGCALTLAMHGLTLEAAARAFAVRHPMISIIRAAYAHAQDGETVEIRAGPIDLAVPLGTAAAISLSRAVHLSPASAVWSTSLHRILEGIPELHRTVRHYTPKNACPMH